ncbi:glycoside hydrolase family 6 protein [Nonomuraea pusilla]|uniref:Serine/threonine protein kinase n=1 Tax=Nonomuraea pusilla TaxID=46177 RepID=A0A1H8EUE4_9ACTN|nr:glycoside hydrolase family 6 protein [Nonomuraea pusilla]SEN22368.1 Serine/threonine protein kinase [Nonomuraea pusilla]
MTLEALRDGDPRLAGPYVLLARLGEGGMGVVYLGQAPDGTRVAVKLIHHRMSADADFRRRFAREVAAARRVARFCTAPVLDADVEGETAYLVTEYVEGPNLEDVVRGSGPLKGSALDGLAASMAVALRAIHGAGVVHRDLKPANVLLSQVGPKVIDFGIARLADAEMSSAIVGTPAYMSPEQVSGSRVGPASDIFSWGSTVAFAATGASPFGSGSVPTILLRIVNEPPALHGLSGQLHDLVEAALRKKPADRPTAQDILDHLSTSVPLPDVPASEAADRVVPVQPHGSPGTSSAQAARVVDEETDPVAGGRGRGVGGPRRWVAGAAAVAVAAAGVAAAFAWQGQKSPDVRDPAANGTSASPAASRSTAARNPLRAGQDVRFYAPPEPAASRQARLWAEDRPRDAELMTKLAAVPYAIRLGTTEVRAKVDSAVTGAEQRNAVPVFLINYLPGSECRPAAAADLAAYHDWINGIAAQIGDTPAAVILEPGSLAKMPGEPDCDPQGSPDQRYKDLSLAVQTLKAHPNTAVYLDGSQDLWPGTELMADRLIGAGVVRADGFFVNTAGFQPTEKAVAYGKKLSACIAVRLATGRKGCPVDAKADPATMPHFVVDTGRNGRGSWVPAKHYSDPQTWCNPPGRGVGDRPTTATGEELVDAYLWIARAGTSGGRCRRGTDGEKDPERGVVAPEAGEWWPELALERAKLANPPLR